MASAKAFRLDALCMHGKVARLCGEGAWNETGWNWRAPKRTTCPSARSPRASPERRVPGNGERHGQRERHGGAPFVGEARVDLADAAIRHKLASGRTDVITFGSGFVTLKADARADERRAAARCRRSAA